MIQFEDDITKEPIEIDQVIIRLFEAFMDKKFNPSWTQYVNVDQAFLLFSSGFLNGMNMMKKSVQSFTEDVMQSIPYSKHNLKEEEYGKTVKKFVNQVMLDLPVHEESVQFITGGILKKK